LSKAIPILTADASAKRSPMPIEGAAAAGHEITRIEVAQLDFPILRTQEEFERGDLPQMLVGARDGIVSAQHLVAIFPLWHGTMPALLKAFLELR